MNIEFYVLPKNSVSSKSELFACQLIEKFYLSQKNIYVHANDKQMTEYLDQLLWTFRDESFIPHHVLESGESIQAPICLGYTEPPQHKDILLNFNASVPDFYQQFKQVIEIVMPDPALQQQARDHYRRYRQDGFTITTHNID